jgi:hypothetical protein
MRLKYVGVNPICKVIQDSTEGFFDGYHPNCCRYPKSCSSGMYELYPEADLEVPKKVRILRVKGVGPGTFVDWMAIGYHPEAKSTVTLLKYFHTQKEGFDFLDTIGSWEQLLKSEGLL